MDTRTVATLACFAAGISLGAVALRPARPVVLAVGETSLPVSLPVLPEVQQLAPVVEEIPEITIEAAPPKRKSSECRLPEGTFGQLDCGFWEVSKAGTHVQRCEIICEPSR